MARCYLERGGASPSCSGCATSPGAYLERAEKKEEKKKIAYLEGVHGDLLLHALAHQAGELAAQGASRSPVGAVRATVQQAAEGVLQV